MHMTQGRDARGVLMAIYQIPLEKVNLTCGIEPPCDLGTLNYQW